MLGSFFALNSRSCAFLERYLPQARTDIVTVYDEIVAKYMNLLPNQVVVDFGGGPRCTFAKYREPKLGTRIIAVDVSHEEMQENHDVDEKRVADITTSMPFARDEVDMITSRFVLEHLADVENFVRLSRRVLKQGGYFIHLVPSKFAPFALINQTLPASLSKTLLHVIYPDTRGRQGFKAYYDNCYYSALKRLFQEHGFRVVDARFGYYQSHYFTFFVPLFLLSSLYEILLWASGAKNLSPYVILVSQKR